MINLAEETIINAPVEKVYKFLANFDKLYKTCHPDHVFCFTLKGKIDKPGSLVHFLEFVGKFPLYLPIRITEVIPNKLLEAEIAPPFHFLKNRHWRIQV